MKNINIIGDIPIFISHNSVDVWAHRDLFKLNEFGIPDVVAGVPPDIFSETGQLWGNPHYRWDKLKDEHYQWWFKRIGHTLDQVECVRLDHFLGFETAWEIPYENTTAKIGEWVKGDAINFFDALLNTFGEQPIIAEDLGIVTAEVLELMKRYHFPGMKILQFALDGGSDNTFLPFNYKDSNCIVYTGTHDNNTTSGWYANASEKEKQKLKDFLHIDENDTIWKLIQTAMESKAVWAIIPAQDILELGESARMNLPGTIVGNWNWQLHDFASIKPALEKLSQLNLLSQR